MASDPLPVVLDLLLPAVLASLTTYVLCRIFLKLALKLNLMDSPNHRSAHEIPTPTGAGICICLVFYAGLLVFWWLDDISTLLLLICLPALLVALTGLIDDFIGLPVIPRTLVHLLSAGLCIYAMLYPLLRFFGFTLDLSIIGPAFGVLYLIWMLNHFNFMDGIDGLAVLQAVFVFLAALGIGFHDLSDDHRILLTLSGAAALGFLVINWPQARVFMGDAGSGFLGLLIGVFSLEMTEVSFWSWLILMAYFLSDATLTLLIRAVRRDRITESHNLHAYQHLTRLRGSRFALHGILVINFGWLLPLAIAANAFREWGLFLLILAALPLLIGEFLLGAGQRTLWVGRSDGRST